MNHIQTLITNVIHSLYGVDFSPEISPAPKKELGEYCIGVFQLTKIVGKVPNMIAEELAQELAKHTETFVSTNFIGGYVNFFLTDTVWWEIFSWIWKNATEKAENKTIVVDYIGANAGKPLHIWHLCTPSVGQTICNIYKHLGYNAIGDSHFGDWGGIFGKLIWEWKNEEIEIICNSLNLSIRNAELYSSQLNHEITREELLFKCLDFFGIEILLSLYQLFHETDSWVLMVWDQNDPTSIINHKIAIKEEWAREEFKKLSLWDNENVALWKRFTSISISEIEIKLDELNVHATYNIGESFYEWLGLRPNNEDYPDLKYTMKDIVQELITKWIATQNEDGSVGVVFPEETKMPSCVLQKKDGTGLYLTSDLAAIKYRLTNGWNPSKIIYCVDVRQQLHLKQAFWIAKAAWPELGVENIEFFHAFNGFIKLKDGAMSTRHGTVIFLEDLIKEGFTRTKNILTEKWRSLSDDNIQAITIGAIKYSYLAQDREKDVVFDWDKALNFEWNSGPYIQYAHVRAKKILPDDFKETKEQIDFTESELSTYDKSLIQSLIRMDDIIQETANKYKPHILAGYSYELAVNFNSFYVHTPKILEEKNESLRLLRLSLCSQFVQQIKLCFELLGISMPTEM